MLTLLALYGGLFLTALVAATLLPAQWTLRRVFTDKQIAEQLRGFWDQN